MASEDQVHVLKLAGRTYAVGLLWNEADDVQKVAEAARAHAARLEDQDLFCVRAGVAQYGLGSRALGHSKGQASLAGHMADSRQGSWLGLFEVDGGYYLLAVRDGEILSETDQVYGDELDAKGKFEELLGHSEWGETFSPASLSFEGAQDVEISSFLTGSRPPTLQDTSKVGSALKWILVIGAGALLIAGGLIYMKIQDDFAYQEQLRRLEEQAKANLPGRNKVEEVQVPPMPWEGRFTAATYVPACSVSMKKAVLSIPGWKPKSISCVGTGNSVMLSIERQAALGSGGGTINWVRWALDRAGMKAASASPTGDNGVDVSWTMEGQLDTSKPALDAPRLADARRYLQSWLEETFTQIRWSNGDRNEFFETMKFRFETPYDPSRFSTILGKVDGLTIDSITLDLGRLRYVVEGAIHEQKPLPAGKVAANRPKQ